MPCTYDGPFDIRDNDRVRDLNKEVKKLSAMLCAVLTVVEAERGGGLLSSGFFPSIDYKEAGVSKVEMIKWWRDHKAADIARRAREAEAARLKELAKNARNKILNTLTAEELEVLKIKL